MMKKNFPGIYFSDTSCCNIFLVSITRENGFVAVQFQDLFGLKYILKIGCQHISINHLNSKPHLQKFLPLKD